MPESVEPTPVKVVVHFDHRLWVIPAILMITAALLYWSLYQPSFASTSSIFGQLGSLVTKRATPIQGESKDRINVLLLGIGGKGHDGGTLTDSIMVASLKPSTRQVALLSLPRDLVVKIDDEGHKINYAYALGGMELVKKKVAQVTGLTLQYYVLLDFSGFRQLIDDVDGIDVTVAQNFVGLYGAKELSTPCSKRNLYYLDDGPYCAISFTEGIEHMAGERALIYARIRKLAPQSPNGDEGSDFARARRQQAVLQGFKDEVLSAGTVLNPAKISSLSTDLEEHLITNIELWEAARMLQLVGLVTPDSIINQTVDDSADGLVHTTIVTETGASVVVPNAGDYDYSEIIKLARNIFTLPPTEPIIAENTDNNTVTEDTISVQILNGTYTVGLASTLAATLEQPGFLVTNVGNALTRDYSITTVYQLTNDIDPTIVTDLQNKVGGALASSRQTETLLSLDSDGSVLDSGADFIIIVGADASSTQTRTE